MTESTRESVEVEIPTGRDARLLVRTHTTPSGREVVAVLPQYLGRGGEWQLKHSGLVLPPEVARALAPALVKTAALVEEAAETIEGATP